MKTLICAGGSGARVLEAVLHLCAAGLGPPSLRVFCIDPDDSNGNMDTTKQLVDRYEACRAAFYCAQGGPDAQAGAMAPFFNTKLDLLNSAQGLQVWRPVNPEQQFRDVLNFTQLKNSQKDVVRLLLTKDELDMPMKVGFLGHPALGAAALSLLPLYSNDEVWKHFSQAIKQDLSQGGETKVVIVGSVFGGTGASAIHPLVRYLRKLPEQNKERLKVAAVALVPYFSFNRAEATKQDPGITNPAKSEWFPLASRSAAEYYRHLQQQDDWDFDAMYWLGDDSPMKVAYSPGGPQQRNPAHFVDLLAGLACFDFLAQTPAARSCYYAGPEESIPADKNVLSWADIPISGLKRENVQNALHQFQATGAVHLGFYGPLLGHKDLQRKARCVPWYLDKFTGGNEPLQSEQNRKNLELLTSYFRENYFPWWHEIHSTNQVRLFNQTSWVGDDGKPVNIRNDRFGNLLYPDDPKKCGLDPVDALFSEMDTAANDVGGADSLSKLYFSILTQAARAFVKKQRTGAELAKDSIS